MSAPADWDWSLRVFDHVDLRAGDYRESVRFYETVLAPLGIRKLFEDDESACFANFNVVRDRPPTRALHLCFHARAREQVDASTAPACRRASARTARPATATTRPATTP